TNEQGPYIVKLSSSTSVTNPEKTNISGAVITIFDNEGNSEILLENSPGEYKTAENGIQGIVGRSYKVRIEMLEGITYESNFQELLMPENIDSIFVKKEYHLNKETGNEETGYQFYVKSQITVPGLLWQLIETYEYNSDYQILYTYLNGALEEFPNSDSLYTCWQTKKVNQIYSYKNQNSKAEITEYPLHYLSAETKKLQIRYSLLLKEYSIGLDEVNYWSAIQEMNSQGGLLLTQQPYQIAGNVKNIIKEDDFVLGYFSVASVSNKRIFVEPIRAEYYISNCYVDSYLLGNLLAFNLPGEHYVTEDEITGKGVISEYCTDCTQKGGVLKKPDFW
ncbi:MAG: DUF4249 domain-containing protein, partial [bacterium]|nr:DUF4249 domain-containing protein [bacterium]